VCAPYTAADPSTHVCIFRCYRDHRDLHSFPTRRSSDLPGASNCSGRRKESPSRLIKNCAVDTLPQKNSSPRSPNHRARLFWTARSEEHTSELQSRENLVCRLLLEKKQERWKVLSNSSVR